MPAPMATLARAAALKAASQPSTSLAGSASATPAACIRARASANLSPWPIASTIKLLVALNTASKPSRRQSGSANSSRLNTGRPSITVLSKRMRRPPAFAAAATRSQFQAIGPLLAVTTSMPSSKASRTWPVETGAKSCSITVSSTSTSAPDARRSSDAGAGRLRRGRRAADRLRGRPPACRPVRRQQAAAGACRLR